MVVSNFEAIIEIVDKEGFDFKTAMPEIEEEEINENATDYEKQGLDRKMLQ